jgi:hypothetical protein
MPMWSRNGGELFPLADSWRNVLMAVTVDDGGEGHEKNAEL